MMDQQFVQMLKKSKQKCLKINKSIQNIAEWSIGSDEDFSEADINKYNEDRQVQKTLIKKQKIVNYKKENEFNKYLQTGQKFFHPNNSPHYERSEEKVSTDQIPKRNKKHEYRHLSPQKYKINQAVKKSQLQIKQFMHQIEESKNKNNEKEYSFYGITSSQEAYINSLKKRHFYRSVNRSSLNRNQQIVQKDNAEGQLNWLSDFLKLQKRKTPSVYTRIQQENDKSQLKTLKIKDLVIFGNINSSTHDFYSFEKFDSINNSQQIYTSQQEDKSQYLNRSFYQSYNRDRYPMKGMGVNGFRPHRIDHRIDKRSKSQPDTVKEILLKTQQPHIQGIFEQNEIQRRKEKFMNKKLYLNDKLQELKQLYSSYYNSSSNQQLHESSMEQVAHKRSEESFDKKSKSKSPKLKKYTPPFSKLQSLNTNTYDKEVNQTLPEILHQQEKNKLQRQQN